ncbi:MAG: hypothetical protein NC517_02455 [Firmicutes bacterium]|nr:hypothetical protein [Bacillota bacterium]
MESIVTIAFIVVAGIAIISAVIKISLELCLLYVGVSNQSLGNECSRCKCHPLWDAFLSGPLYMENQIGSFRFCISPLDKYNYDPQGFGCHDRVVKKEGKLYMTGWWIDEKSGQPFGAIYVEADGKKYTAEPLERPDVVAAYEQDAYLWSGYQTEIPDDTLRATDHIVITGITDEGEKRTLCEFKSK